MFEFPVGVIALLTFLFTQGIKALLDLFGKDISGKSAAFTAVVVASILFFFTGVVGIFPPTVQEQIVAAIQLVGVILSGFGIHYTYKGVAG